MLLCGADGAFDTPPRPSTTRWSSWEKPSTSSARLEGGAARSRNPFGVFPSIGPWHWAHIAGHFPGPTSSAGGRSEESAPRWSRWQTEQENSFEDA